jgi:hypothetical protein
LHPISEENIKMAKGKHAPVKGAVKDKVGSTEFFFFFFYWLSKYCGSGSAWICIYFGLPDPDTGRQK